MKEEKNIKKKKPERLSGIIPISEVSSKWVLHRTWSMGVIVPSFAPLFWILRMLVTLDRSITDMVPAIVFTVAGPFPIFTWSRPFITSSLNGPILTIRSNATMPSANKTKNSNWIIFTQTLWLKNFNLPSENQTHFAKNGKLRPWKHRFRHKVRTLNFIFPLSTF